MIKKIAFVAVLSFGSLPLLAKTPAWVSGADARYPEQQFITGVGLGDDLDVARANARAEVARTLESRVQQTLTDSQTETSTSRGKRQSPSLGTQTSGSNTLVTTDTFLEGVSVKETWFNKKTKKNYALAVLDKGALRRAIQTQTTDEEQIISSALASAEKATTPLDRVRELSRAKEAAERRNELVARRRVVDPVGLGDPEGTSTAVINEKWRNALSAVPVNVEAEAPKESHLAHTVTEALTNLGITIQESPSPTGLTVKTSLQVTPFDRGNPDWVFYQWAGSVQLMEAATGKTIAGATPDGTEGHPVATAAQTKAQNAGEEALAKETARLITETLFK